MNVEITVHHHVATITLNRPHVQNAYDMGMRRELQAAWERVRTDDDIWVAIVTGAGKEAFCVGRDPDSPHANADVAYGIFGRHNADALLSGLDTDKPLICAVNGIARGGGFEMALACDIRVASHAATFALPEVRVAGIPGAGGTQRLPRLLGRSDAMRMLMTGRPITAEVALRNGLVSEVVADEELMPLARAIAKEICANAQLAVRAAKRLVKIGLDMPEAAALACESFAYGLIRETQDAREARLATSQQREPVFTGR
jgi:E-phenylitaconyl-CoA hydratase